MLTPAEIADLRSRVTHRTRCCRKGIAIRFKDGPLDSLEGRVEGRVHSLGWSTLTDRGAIVAMYTPTDDCHVWRFREYDRPGARASGLE